MTMPETQPAGLDRLRNVLDQARSEGILVAMSGGVDSCTLAAVAFQVLGEEAMLAVTLDAESNAQRELEDARAFAAAEGIPHRVVDHTELADPAYRENTPMRCYHCRDGMTDRLEAVADEEDLGRIGMGYLPDDAMQHTPGRRAAREAEAWFPYVEAGVDKQAVRGIAEHLSLSVADRPSNACLSSRIPYGSEVTGRKLEQVERAEEAVRSVTGVEQVRVRHHGDVARVEVLPQQRRCLLDHAEEVTARLEDVGFTYVSMDLRGYRTGAMNEALGAPVSRE